MMVLLPLDPQRSVARYWLGSIDQFSIEHTDGGYSHD